MWPTEGLTYGNLPGSVMNSFSVETQKLNSKLKMMQQHVTNIIILIFILIPSYPSYTSLPLAPFSLSPPLSPPLSLPLCQPPPLKIIYVTFFVWFPRYV